MRLVPLAALACLAASPARSQTAAPPAPPAPQSSAAGHWSRFAAGAAASVLAHEAAHVVAALALGARPSFSLDAAGRPTVWSGIDAEREPGKQFVFSAAGLTAQQLVDEVVLDLPHRPGSRAGAFERGVIAGGIGTVLFYTTIGRNGAVSDVDFMARTSSLSKGEVSLIYGGVAALHAVRVGRGARYARFFARPAAEGGLRVGVDLRAAPAAH